ncbi:hypothetical protein ACHAW6_001524 [Cyclotella cf. meneghiniana]
MPQNKNYLVFVDQFVSDEISGVARGKIRWDKNIRDVQSRLRMSSMSRAITLYRMGGTSSYGRLESHSYLEEAARKFLTSERWC